MDGHLAKKTTVFEKISQELYAIVAVKYNACSFSIKLMRRKGLKDTHFRGSLKINAKHLQNLQCKETEIGICQNT